jgi:Protein of unknown function (DUF2939)
MRWFVGIVVALLVGTAIYLASAIVSLHGLIEAARAGDGAGVLARTDTARVRRSLVDQIVTAYLARLGRDRPVKTLERLAANTYGASIADAMIAQMLSEEKLTNILNKGAISSGGNAVGNMPRLTDIDTSSVLETLRRISPVKPVEFFVRLGPQDSAGGISLHFKGNGWKLSGIELPSTAVEALAQNLVNRRDG